MEKKEKGKKRYLLIVILNVISLMVFGSIWYFQPNLRPSRTTSTSETIVVCITNDNGILMEDRMRCSWNKVNDRIRVHCVWDESQDVHLWVRGDNDTNLEPERGVLVKIKVRPFSDHCD